MKSLRLNIGCGEKIIDGFVNIDNSPSSLLARYKVLSWLAETFGLLSKEQQFLVSFYKKNNVRRADLRKGLPFPSRCVDMIYSSHVFEHLSREDARSFLLEARRCLKPGTGCLRLIVPSLSFIVDEYLDNKDADYFVTRLVMATPVPKTLPEKLLQLVFGFRHHLWMYDDQSLSKIISDCGFDDVKVVEPGRTTMPNVGNLDLNERGAESIIVECYYNQN